MNFTLITAFSLCSLCWFSVSGSQFQTLHVQSGKDNTLTCSDIREYDTLTTWFRVVNRTLVSVISTVYPSGNKEQKNDELPKGKYETVSKGSDIFLKIKSLDSSDSGLYLCGIVRDGKLLFSGTYLKIDSGEEPGGNMESKHSDGMVKRMSMAPHVLAGVLLMVSIGLAVQIWRLKKAQEKQNPDQRQKCRSDDLNDAAVTFEESTKT